MNRTSGTKFNAAGSPIIGALAANTPTTRQDGPDDPFGWCLDHLAELVIVAVLAAFAILSALGLP